MPEFIYIVTERRGNGDFSLTPYLSEESAKKHYEENLSIYTDLSKPFYPIIENRERTHFIYNVRGALCFECSYVKEEVYA